LAVVTAFGELLVRLADLNYRHKPLGAGPSIVWMAPLMNLVWFAGGALLVIIGRRLIPGIMTPKFSLALLMMPAFISAVWLIPSVHLEAALLLALGLAIQTGRILATRTGWLTRLTRRAFAPAVIGTLILIVAVTGWLRVRESRAMAALPDAEEGTPNVLLLILDTVRSYNLSAYGYARPTTPMLERLARTSVQFDRAFAPSSWTMPSHATLFTARWPYEHRTGPYHPLPSGPPTLAELLNNAGMATGGFTANFEYLNWEYGLARGFTHFEDYPDNLAMFFTSTSIGQTLMEYNTFRKPLGFFGSPKGKTARTVNDQFLEWVDELDPDRPFFAFLNYFDAHHPYSPPEPYLTRFGPHGAIRWRGQELKFAELSEEEISRKLNQYDGGIAYLDAEIERLLAALEARGELDSTIVVIASDHGEHWGDHDRLSHGNSMYRQLLQVPLIIAAPESLPSGSRVSTSVSLRDLPATILDAAGVQSPVEFPGTSLIPIARGDSSAPRSPVFSEGAPFGAIGARSLIDDSLHYIRRLDGSEELYDLEHDSLEVHNLSGNPAYTSVLYSLRVDMDAIVGASRPPDVRPQ
jgi:arylsulfatase A-like enzyme